MSAIHIKANIEIIPSFTASCPQAQEIATLYLTEAQYEPELIDDEISKMVGGTVFAAIDNNGGVIATATLIHMEGVPEGVIIHVATRKDHHREGLGSQVLGKLADVATQEGLTHLHVFPLMESKKFYIDQGFDYDPTKSFNTSWVTKSLH